MNTSYEETIRERYRDLEINHIEINDIGQNNDVLIVNNRIVFRFPKYIEGIKKLEKETKVLDHIKDEVSFSIPDPLYRSLETKEVGKVFTGYKIIEGTPLYSSAVKRIEDEEVLQRIALHLVQFLTELHAQPIKDLHIEKQTAEDVRKSIEALYLKFQQKLYPYMNKHSQAEVTQNFEAFLSNDNLLNFDTVLIHGDFGASNILWDANSKQIAGIIDFGETEIGDPAYDFAGLLASYGDSFIKRCLRLYPEGDNVFERIKFYQSTFALQEALHGIEKDDREAFENGIKAYR